ncbi:MAG: YicC family protein [Nitrospirae bacterium]|nr:YicC family protein [Nitrospirota bacterium]
MKIQSMTGYGVGISGNFKVEVRSSNHRGLDIQIKIPSYLYFYEPEIRKLVKKNFLRGRIEILVSISNADTLKFKINKSVATEFYNILTSLKQELSISGEIGIDILASQKDIFLQEEPEVELTSLSNALDIALQDLKKMRIEEGENLVKDINERLSLIKIQVEDLEGKRVEFIAQAKASLSERLRSLFEDIQIDESRIIQEAAILLDRSDITEEIVRIKSHLTYIENMLQSGNSIGKKLDFITQELYREINTIGSKAANVEITPIVVELKSEVEKIREQTQNLQ